MPDCGMLIAPPAAVCCRVAGFCGSVCQKEAWRVYKHGCPLLLQGQEG